MASVLLAQSYVLTSPLFQTNVPRPPFYHVAAKAAPVA